MSPRFVTPASSSSASIDAQILGDGEAQVLRRRPHDPETLTNQSGDKRRFKVIVGGLPGEVHQRRRPPTR
ncbi:MAG: hypothetical protein KKI02_12620 [Planctomycetes bacterium]|nr:hypothetical protein [Planctomycetota bacterium]